MHSHVKNHLEWQEQEIQELRRLYEDERKMRRNLEEENEKLKAEVEVLKERLLEASKK